MLTDTDLAAVKGADTPVRVTKGLRLAWIAIAGSAQFDA